MTDDLAALDEQALARLGAALGVRREDGEALDAYRARVAERFNDDAAVLAADTEPRPMVLGAMKMGE